MRLKTDTVLKYISPVSDISEATSKEVWQMVVKDARCNEARLSEMDAELLRASVGVECVNKQGTYVKRIVKELKKKGFTIPQKTLSAIGNVIGTKADKNQTYYFDIYNVNHNRWWNSEGFGQSGGSCYWSDGRRDYLLNQTPPFFALRYFNTEDIKEDMVDTDSTKIMQGHSRCWIRRYSDFLVLFNGYGAPLLRQARLLSMYLGLSYEEAYIHNQGETDGRLYINMNGKGYVLGKQEVLDKLKEDDCTTNDAGTRVCVIDFDMEIEEGYSCYYCEGHVHSEDVCELDGRFMCPDCFTEYTGDNIEGERIFTRHAAWSEYHDCYVEQDYVVHSDALGDVLHARWAVQIEDDWYPKGDITKKRDGSIWYDGKCIKESEEKEEEVSV